MIGVRASGVIEYAYAERIEYGRSPEDAQRILRAWAPTAERALSLVRLGELRALGQDDLRCNREGALHGRFDGDADAYIRMTVQECAPDMAALYDMNTGDWQVWATGEIVVRDILADIATEVSDGRAKIGNLRTAFESSTSQTQRNAGRLRREVREAAGALATRYFIARDAASQSPESTCVMELASTARELYSASRTRELRWTKINLRRAEDAAERASSALHERLVKAERVAADIPWPRESLGPAGRPERDGASPELWRSNATLALFA